MTFNSISNHIEEHEVNNSVYTKIKNILKTNKVSLSGRNSMLLQFKGKQSIHIAAI